MPQNDCEYDEIDWETKELIRRQGSMKLWNILNSSAYERNQDGKALV